MLLRDVAATADVSLTTASDALNGSGRLDRATRERVLAVARQLGYRANPHARMLRRGGLGMLAVASSLPAGLRHEAATIEYYARLITSAASAATAAEYAAVLLPVQPSPDHLRQLGVDGALLLDPVADDPLVAVLESERIPLVSTGRSPDRPRDTGRWVDNDLYAATRTVLDLLAARGARAPALVTNPPVRSYTIDTLRAYEDWAAERGLPPRIAVTEPVASEGAGYRAAAEMLDAPQRPDAIYAPLDRLAAGALQAARTRGIAIPHELQIAAGSDSELTRTADPPITALELHPDRIGTHAIGLLLELVADPHAGTRHVIVDAEVAERGSTLLAAPR